MLTATIGGAGGLDKEIPQKASAPRKTGPVKTEKSGRFLSGVTSMVLNSLDGVSPTDQPLRQTMAKSSQTNAIVSSSPPAANQASPSCEHSDSKLSATTLENENSQGPESAGPTVIKLPPPPGLAEGSGSGSAQFGAPKEFNAFAGIWPPQMPNHGVVPPMDLSRVFQPAFPRSGAQQWEAFPQPTHSLDKHASRVAALEKKVEEMKTEFEQKTQEQLSTVMSLTSQLSVMEKFYEQRYQEHVNKTGILEKQLKDQRAQHERNQLRHIAWVSSLEKRLADQKAECEERIQKLEAAHAARINQIHAKSVESAQQIEELAATYTIQELDIRAMKTAQAQHLQDLRAADSNQTLRISTLMSKTADQIQDICALQISSTTNEHKLKRAIQKQEDMSEQVDYLTKIVSVPVVHAPLPTENYGDDNDLSKSNDPTNPLDSSPFPSDSEGFESLEYSESEDSFRDVMHGDEASVETDDIEPEERASSPESHIEPQKDLEIKKLKTISEAPSAATASQEKIPQEKVSPEKVSPAKTSIFAVIRPKRSYAGRPVQEILKKMCAVFPPNTILSLSLNSPPCKDLKVTFHQEPTNSFDILSRFGAVLQASYSHQVVMVGIPKTFKPKDLEDHLTESYGYPLASTPRVIGVRDGFYTAIIAFEKAQHSRAIVRFGFQRDGFTFRARPYDPEHRTKRRLRGRTEERLTSAPSKKH